MRQLSWHGLTPNLLPCPALPCPHSAPTRAVVALCHAVRAHCVALGLALHGVLPLRAAVAKLCPSTDLLSPIHADFFQL
jgi:hypothetical protein